MSRQSVAHLFNQEDLTEAEAKMIEAEYASDGWKTVREPVVFHIGAVSTTVAVTLVLYRDQYGEGWEKNQTWDID